MNHRSHETRHDYSGRTSPGGKAADPARNCVRLLATPSDKRCTPRRHNFELDAREQAQERRQMRGRGARKRETRVAGGRCLHATSGRTAASSRRTSLSKPLSSMNNVPTFAIVPTT